MNQSAFSAVTDRNLHASRLLFASLAEPSIVEKAVAALVRQLRPACARQGTVALTALEFDFENSGARCEFLLYHTGHSSGTPGNVCDRLNTGAALRHLETGFPGGSRVRFRQLRFRPAEASSRGLLLHAARSDRIGLLGRRPRRSIAAAAGFLRRGAGGASHSAAKRAPPVDLRPDRTGFGSLVSVCNCGVSAPAGDCGRSSAGRRRSAGPLSHSAQCACSCFSW